MRIVPSLLALGFCLGLGAPAAVAAPYDGKWVADIPAQGRCNSTGTMTVVVAGGVLSGQVVNPSGRNPPFTGEIDPDGSANFLVDNRYPGTMRFAGDHFDATWNNGACDRHAQGDRALDEGQRSARVAERKQHQGLYADLVRRAQAGDKTVDYTALRAESVYSENWDFYDTKARGLLEQADVAAKGKDCALALAKADAALKLDFTMDSAHAVKADCLKKTGQADKARIEQDIADGLIHSLMDSGARGTHGIVHAVTAEGDGGAEDSAYVVNSYREELDVLANRHIQLKVRQTEMRGSNGHYYDRIQGISIRNNVAVKAVYFDISSFVNGRASHRAAAETAMASVH